MKPGDFFIGVVDFFAVVIPGAILAAYAEWHLDRAGLMPRIPGQDAGRWIAFAVAAYGLGQLLFMLAASWLDGVYDRIRRRLWPVDDDGPFSDASRKRHATFGTLHLWESFVAKVASERSARQREDQELFRARAAARGDPDPPNPAEVERKARDIDADIKKLALKRAEEDAALAKERRELDRPMNTFKWARAHLIISSASAGAEVLKLEAQQKFFRSSSLGAAVLAAIEAIRVIASDKPPSPAGPFLLAFASGLAFWAFVRARHKATEATYQFALVHAVSLQRPGETGSGHGRDDD